MHAQERILPNKNTNAFYALIVILSARRLVALRNQLVTLNVCIEVIRAILFDAAGTLFFLTKTVGDHYAYVGREVGLNLDAEQLERACHTAWKQMPQRAAIAGPRKNDDKGWWRELVGRVFDQVAPS